MKAANRTTARRVFLLTLSGALLSGCVTSRIENIRENTTGIAEGEGIVIMAKSYHLGNETEAKFINCVGSSVGRGSKGLHVIPNNEFVDALFPWFEPRTAPAEAKSLPTLMSRPGVAQKIKDKGVRYVVWLNGETEKVAGGGSMSCAAGPGGGGCFGFAWWQNDSNYEASVWDLDGLEDAGRSVPMSAELRFYLRSWFQSHSWHALRTKPVTRWPINYACSSFQTSKFRRSNLQLSDESLRSAHRCIYLSCVMALRREQTRAGRSLSQDSRH